METRTDVDPLVLTDLIDCISDADRKRWRESVETWDQPNAAMYRKGVFLEMWCAGCWLGEQLDARGASCEVRDSVCFAAGQSMAFRPDPWPYAVAALEKFIRGEPDVPGDEMAKKLCDDVFGSAI